MDRTRNAVERMLAALGAPAYDLGILSERGMLPGLSNLPTADVFSRLRLLKAHNTRGAHIYIRPAGEHRFTVLDDLNSDSVARLFGDGLGPCAVVETSLGNFQAWLKHNDVYPPPLSTFIAQTLAKRYGADPSAAGLAALWPSSRIHQLQAQVPQGQRPLPLCPPAKRDRSAVPAGPLIYGSK